MPDKFGIPAIPPPGETSRLYNVLVEQRAQLIRWINELVSRINGIVIPPGGLTPPVLLSQIETIPGVSVLGRALNSVGLIAPITATADGQLLQRLGGTLIWAILPIASLPGNIPLAKLEVINQGTVLGLSTDEVSPAPPQQIVVGTPLQILSGLLDIEAGGISNAHLRAGAARSVVGRAAGSAGAVADIVAANASNFVLRELSGSIGWGLLGSVNIAAGGIGDANLRNSLALSVIGRAVNSVGTPADIPAILNSNAVLRESAGTIGWGLVGTNNLADGGVTGIKFRASVALSVVGRSVNTVGAVGDITAVAASGTVLMESGSTLVWALITGANMSPTANISLGQLANGAALSVVGRSANSTGPHADIAAAFASDFVLMESGGTLVWNKVSSVNILAGGVSRANLSSGLALSVVGRAVNSVGVLADIAATAGGFGVLQESGSTLIWALIGSSNIAAGAIGNAQLRNGAALSVVGRAVNSVGALADIVATAGGNGVLTERGSALIWALLTDTNIAAAAGILKSKLENSLALSVVGRSANTPGAPADIATGAGSGTVLRESANTIGWGLIVSANISNAAAITRTQLAQGAARSVIGVAGNATANVADIAATAASNHVLRESGSTIGWGLLTNANLDPAAAIAKSKLENSVGCSVVGRSVNSAGATADIVAGADNTFLTRKAGVVAFTAPATAFTLHQKVYDSPTFWGQSAVAYPTLAQTNPTGFTLTNAERHFLGFIMSNGNINWLRFGFAAPADTQASNITPRIVFVLNGAPAAGVKVDLTIRGAIFNDNDLSSGGTAFFVNTNVLLTGYAAADYVIMDLTALGLSLNPGQYIQGVIERHALSNPADTYPDIIGIAVIAFRGTRAIVL